jgi:hypothetical protein
MKLENTSSTCFCSTYSSMTIKYTTLLNEYISENQKLKKEIEALKFDIQYFKDYIKYTL